MLKKEGIIKSSAAIILMACGTQGFQYLYAPKTIFNVNICV